jgi:phosphoglycolate phosphatase
MIEAILFDKDGTLFDFYRTWGAVTEEAALIAAEGDAARATDLMLKSGKDAVTGRYLPGSVIASGSNREIVALWAELLGRTDVDSLYTSVAAHFLNRQTEVMHPVVDFNSFFARLRDRGYRLGIATMDSEIAAHQAMDKFGVKQALDFICGFDTGHGTKPGGGMVEAFARLMQLPASAIAVVGDSPHDMHMARAGQAGRAIGVLTGVSSKDALLEAGAHVVLESIADLEAAL